MAFQVVVSFLSSFRGSEFFTSGRLQKGAASLQHMGDVFGIEFFDVILDHSLVAAVDSIHLKAIIKSGSYCSANSRIHSR